MSGDRYFINDQEATYFLTLTIVNWIDVFSRKDYRYLITDSLNYCIKNKGLVLNAWVIMSNHIHLIGRVESPIGMSGFLRDFKKFTSKSLIKQINLLNESRRAWLLNAFSFEATKTKRNENYKVWRDSNHAVDLSNNPIDIFEQINYVHMNPVKADLVREPEHYNFSSAIDYMGRNGLVKVEIL